MESFPQTSRLCWMNLNVSDKGKLAEHLPQISLSSFKVPFVSGRLCKVLLCTLWSAARKHIYSKMTYILTKQFFFHQTNSIFSKRACIWFELYKKTSSKAIS